MFSKYSACYSNAITVQVFEEGHKTETSNQLGVFVKFCGLLRKPDLYMPNLKLV